MHRYAEYSRNQLECEGLGVPPRLGMSVGEGGRRQSCGDISNQAGVGVGAGGRHREVYRHKSNGYVEDQKVVLLPMVAGAPGEVYQVCEGMLPPGGAGYYGGTGGYLGGEGYEMCCCDEEWYRHYCPEDMLPPCPPAPVQSVVLYDGGDHQQTMEPRVRLATSRSSSLGRRPPSQQQHRRTPHSDDDDEDDDDEDDIVALGQVVLGPDCRCSCDHIAANGNYRQLKEVSQPKWMLKADALSPVSHTANFVENGLPSEITPVKDESGQFPPLPKEEMTFYPASSATSISSTSGKLTGCMELMRCRQRWIVAAAVLLAAAAGVAVPLALQLRAEAPFQERLQMAATLLQETPLIDGHNDLPWNIRKFVHNRLSELKFGEDLRKVPPWSRSAWSHTDLQRLRSGRVAAQFWAAYVPCESQFKDAVQLTLEQIDVIKRLTDKYSPPLTFCASSNDIFDAHSKGKVCSLIGVEGGHSLANSLPVLRTLYGLGVRYLTLTSTCNTQWADSSLVDTPGKKAEHGGLTNFGKIVVKEMNRLGMLVDLSHVSVKTMKAALDVSKAPVVFSHSSARALCNSSRNVPDHILGKLSLNGGLVMVNFYSQFLTCQDVATVSDAVAHINHIREVAGVDSVGLGAGYDGINFTPKGLEDVSSYPALFAELIGSGQWSIEDLKKLAGLNFLRVLKAVEKVRDDMAKSGVEPYEDTISPRYLKGRSNCTSQDPF